MDEPRNRKALSALIHARDYRALDAVLEIGPPAGEADIEAIAQAMSEVEFGRLTLTQGWWSLAKKLLPRSRTLRHHAFTILAGASTPTVGDAYRKTDRSNLLHAVAPLNLSADEIAVLRRLREQISPQVYREDVDAVLFEHTTREEQLEALREIWIEAAGGATREAKADPLSEEAVMKPSAMAPQETRWRQSPFRLLVCMPFRVPEVSRVWVEQLQPALESLGDVLRLDWSTDDWVRDIRRIADEAAFVLVDLTLANPNVRWELGHLLRKEIPCVCYANGTGALSTVGQVHPTLAADNDSIDPEVWGLPVYMASYGSDADVDRLISHLERKLRPFQDLEDPTAPYVGRDLSALRAVERRGFELARVPRSRVSAERLAKEGKDLISESAIFRARMFSWLANPNLHIHCPENLWLREHLLWVVRDGIRRGYRLTLSESEALEVFLRAETSQSIRDLGVEIGFLARRASEPSPAEKHGLPAPPSPLPESSFPGSQPVCLRIKLIGRGEPIGLRASVWPQTFGATAAELRKVMTGQFGLVSKRRIFVLKADGPVGAEQSAFLGDIEDALDSVAEPLSALTLDMVRSGWSRTDIETFLQATVSLAILRELRRRRLFEAGGGDAEHERMAEELGYIWERPSGELRLFEFSSGSRPMHFRGLFPWADVKEEAMRVYSGEAARLLQGRLTEDEIFEQAMGWDYLPAQLWDAIIRTRMTDVAPAEAMRSLWARYVLPSAFLYWRREQIYSDPAETQLWAYV